MEWIKKNWLTLLCAFGLAALTAFRNYQFKEEVRMMKAVLVNPDTGKPTEWCRSFLFNPMINEATSETKILTIEAFKDAGNVALLVDAMGVDANSIKKSAELGMGVLHVMDSLGVTMKDFCELFKTRETEFADSYTRGIYRFNKITNKPTHRFDIEDGWRELFYGIPDKYKKEYCKPFYWFLKRNGEVMPDRVSSNFEKCN